MKTASVSKGNLPEMKRDMEFIREILRTIEESPEADNRHDLKLSIPPHSSLETAYHVDLLLQANFVNADTSTLPVIVRGLTWNGHEFLANIKNDDIWSKTKEHFASLQDVGLHIVASFAESLIKKQFGL